MFFSTKTITVEFGCSKADRPKMLADPTADIVFAYAYMHTAISTGLERAGNVWLGNTSPRLVPYYWVK